MYNLFIFAVCTIPPGNMFGQYSFMYHSYTVDNLIVDLLHVFLCNATIYDFDFFAKLRGH